MKKIRLELDALTVESFSTEEVTPGEGTVHARGSEGYPGACTPSESDGDGCFCLPDLNPDTAGCG